MGVVVIDGQAVKAAFGKGSVFDFISSHCEACGVAGRNAAGPKEHDGGGSKGGAVAFFAFCQEIGNEIFSCRCLSRASGITVIFSKETADILYPLPLFRKAPGRGNGSQGGKALFYGIRNIQIMVINEAAVFLLGAQIGAEIGVAAVFFLHHGEKGTGRQVPQVGAVGLAFPAHGGAVIGKEGGAEAGIVGKKEERRLFIHGVYVEILFQAFHRFVIFHVVGKALGKGRASGYDFHEPGPLVVPFALILLK